MKYRLGAMLLWLSCGSWADDGAGNIAGKLGQGTLNNLNNPTEYVPRYTDNPAMAEQYYGEGISLPTQFGEDKIARCRSEKAHTDLYLRQECEGINFVTNGQTQRPNVTVSANEKLVQGTQKIAGDPAETLDKYKWKYPIQADGSIGTVPNSACPTETIQIPAVIKEKTCNEYTGVELFLCQAALKVNVDPNWNYSCLESKYRNETYQCANRLTVVCEQEPDCTNAGVKAGSIQADMHVRFDKVSDKLHRLTFGTISDNYWADGSYDREMNLEIQGKDRMQVFSLKHVAYDDWLLIKVNGHVVYSSAGGQIPFYADYANAKYGARYAPVKNEITKQQIGVVERSTSWSKDLNIDIRPYLVEGKNTIWTRTLVGRFGESAAVFEAYQYCQPVCHERWDNECADYERRVR